MRSRGSSHTDRRRTERDAELRRRRQRQLSQASERIRLLQQQQDAELLDGTASASASPSTAPPQPQNAHTAFSPPRNTNHEASSLFGPATAAGAGNRAPRFSMDNGVSHNQTHHPFPARSVSYGGTQQTDTISAQYNRTMAEVQEQLDSMRALLGGNLSSDERQSVASAASASRQDRADMEEDLLRFMEDSSDDMASSPGWGRRRAGLIHDGRARRYDEARNPSLRDEKAKEAELINKTAAFTYTIGRNTTRSDVWPDMRDPSKVPARYRPVDMGAVCGKGGKRRRSTPGESWMHEDEDDSSATIVWPMNELPSEIYYLIVESLSRDDIEAMRLTCKEMEHHLSGILFKTVVVPFNTEIYGMLHGVPPQKVDVKGKGKGKAKSAAPGSVEFWKNSKDEDIYTGHGVDVFKSFGPRMKRFGMSFEVDEAVLANPPLKGTREDHMSYWGVYQWPYPEYKRFDQVAGLEDAADETPKMKTAFGFLTEVRELALSLDAGLGWLNGPDKSIRTRVLGDHQEVFGRHLRNRQEDATQWFWEYLKAWAARSYGVDLRHCTLTAQELTTNPNDFGEFDASLPGLDVDLPDVPFLDLSALVDPIAKGVIWHTNRSDATSLFRGRSDAQASDATGDSVSSFVGGLMFVREDSLEPDRVESHPIVPSELSKLQKEWLLETEWAQRAFLSSWLIAVVDNRLTFQHVHTINFARISSRYLLSLCREDLWRALPQLNKVALNVIPDCRDVTKDNAGFVDTPRIASITAVFLLQKLVSEMFALRSSIKSLELGWADGGERAHGLLARNRQVMPAAILPSEWLANAENMANKTLLESCFLQLPHVKDLTLKNCWLTPHALTYLVKEHTGLERLCLESVSLTAEPTPNNGPNPQQVVALAQQIQGPLMPQHGAQQPGPNAGAWHQQMQHTFMQAVQNVNHLAVAAGINGHGQQQNVGNTDWLNPRVGSWPHVLDSISPGVTMAAAGCTVCPVNLPAALPGHALQTLELKSAGYCRLNNPRLDESAVPPATFGGGSPWFTKRFSSLSKVMLNSRSLMVAEIVQAIPQSEEQALTMGFDLDLGWPLEWAAEIEAPFYDGCLPGGTGRFHGTIHRLSRVVPVSED